MQIYKDMIEKLKFHKSNILNSFIKKNYYPSSKEIEEKLSTVDARLALFEAYISRPGSYMDIKKLNHCFDMIVKDIEILYTVLEKILIEDYSALSIHIEAALTELEKKADYYKKRCSEEMYSSTLGTTVFFQSNSWNVIEEDEMNIIDLGTLELVEGMDIACFANVENIDSKDIVFQFENNDTEKSFLALPYNYNNNSYRVPGEIGINNIDIAIPVTSIVNDYIPIEYNINFENKYKIAGAVGGMQVTLRSTGETLLYRFANIDNAFVAPEDCFVEFFVLDGHEVPNNYMEYSFTEAPISTNFSLQNGEIPLNKEVVRISIECQKGLGMFFMIPSGTAYATFEEPIIVNKNTLVYNGNWDIRDFVLREYVRCNKTNYRVKLFIKSDKDIIDNIESIYIKEVSS